MNNNLINILVTGDFSPVNRISDLIFLEKFDDVFGDFIPILKNKDLAITNLECPLINNGETIKKTGPILRGPVTSAKALSNSGFNLITLANNHIMDYGFRGLKSTIDACNEYDLDFIGAGENYLKAKQIYYKKIGEAKIAILNFAENEFSTTNGNFPGANPLDPIENYYDIITAKENSDHVILIIHGGHETYDLPCPRIKKLFRFYAHIGASAIFAHHSHCYSGYEIYNGVPIFYGLGNFIFDKPDKSFTSWNYGYAVELILSDILNFKVIPYEQCNENPGIKLLNKNEEHTFYNNIKRLNSIILDDFLLQNEFDKFTEKVKRRYFSYIEPHSIKLFHYLRNRNLFPSFLSKKKKRLYLNLMRCESHREMLIKILDSENENIKI